MGGTFESDHAKVLVVSDDASDASQVMEQLRGEFPAIRASTNPDVAVAGFEADLPDVLVLAFKELGTAQEYLVGLLRLGGKARVHKFRTVLLCDKSNVAKAYELCKKGHFDDYVLYWPLSYEGSRLPMCVWVAVRALAAVAVKPSEAELRDHFMHLKEAGAVATASFKSGAEQMDATSRALRSTHESIDAALNEVRVQASEAARQSGGSPAMEGWAERLRLLQEHRLKPALVSATAALSPVQAWRKDFQQRLDAELAKASELITKVGVLRPTLLVVDDDPLARKVVAAALAESGYALLFAADGNEAFLVVGSTIPDLILMDVNLPGLDGVALTKKLKSTAGLNQIPVLMLTGDSRPETVARSVGAGAASFLVKPFTRPALLAKLEALLKPKPAS